MDGWTVVNTPYKVQHISNNPRYRPAFDKYNNRRILTLSKPWCLQKTKPTSPQKVRRKLFPNRNENTGRHEPTVSHFAWFYQARRYQARALNQVVNKDEENIVRRSDILGI